MSWIRSGGGQRLGAQAPLDRRVAIQGQSNAIGRAARTDITASPLSADAGLAAYNAAPFARVYIFNPTSLNYEALEMGVNQQVDGNTLTQFGPEFGLAVRWMRETTGGRLFIDKQADGGQPISHFQSGGTYFTNSISRHTAADSWLASNGVGVVDGGWLWVQGESDQSATQSAYETALTTYVNSRISNLLQTTAARRVVAQMPVGSAFYGAGVADAKTSYAASNSSTTRLVTLTHLQVDDTHCNGQGQVQLGYDFYEQLFDAAHISA